MSSPQPPQSGLPTSMGPGARPLQPGERPDSLLREITDIRSHYQVHLASDAVDLYYDLKGQQRHFRLPFDNMPVGGWTKSLCWSGRNSAQISGTLLIDMIRACENMTGRTLNQEEAEGIAFYSSRRIMTMYVGQATSIGMGVASAWVGRKEMKFPFMKPKAPERYESFPLRVLPILKGQYARFSWQITRANVYVILWLFLTAPLFKSVADTRLTVGLYADRRTHDMAEQVKGKFDRLRSNRASEAANGVRTGLPPAQNTQAQDEASPTAFDDSQSFGGQDDSAGDGTFTDGNTDTGLISDATMQQRQTQQASPNSWSRAQSRGSRESFQKQQDNSSSSDFLFDDASPTAGNNPDMGTAQPYTKQRPGNAWNRVRRGGNAESSAGRQTTPEERSSFGDQPRSIDAQSESFSYSNRDEEKQLAKDRAQREFDAMLDQERREGGSADYARDMRATESGSESNSSTEDAWARRRRG